MLLINLSLIFRAVNVIEYISAVFVVCTVAQMYCVFKEKMCWKYSLLSIFAYLNFAVDYTQKIHGKAAYEVFYSCAKMSVLKDNIT
jgi:hypothetical protein